jgi:hypothetical protein
MKGKCFKILSILFDEKQKEKLEKIAPWRNVLKA